jgi:hypothetical protein
MWTSVSVSLDGIAFIQAVRGFDAFANPFRAKCQSVVVRFRNANRGAVRPNQCRFTHKAPPKVV